MRCCSSLAGCWEATDGAWPPLHTPCKPSMRAVDGGELALDLGKKKKKKKKDLVLEEVGMSTRERDHPMQPPRCTCFKPQPCLLRTGSDSGGG